jgi:hypothetical protein
MDQENELEMKDLFDRVCQLTETLLSEGAHAGELVFALTSVAADMGFQVNHDPLETFTAMMAAIRNQTASRLETTESADAVEESIGENVEDTEMPTPVTVH